MLASKCDVQRSLHRNGVKCRALRDKCHSCGGLSESGIDKSGGSAHSLHTSTTNCVGRYTRRVGKAKHHARLDRGRAQIDSRPAPARPYRRRIRKGERGCAEVRLELQPLHELRKCRTGRPAEAGDFFAAAFGVTVDYLYFGDGFFLKQIEGARAFSSRMPRRIPLVALENMTDLERIASGQEPAAAGALPSFDQEGLPDRPIFIEIADKSMSNPQEPVSFEPGDKALIDLDAEPTPGDFVLALVPEEKTALFRLYREVGRAEDGSYDRGPRSAQPQFPHPAHLEWEPWANHRRVPKHSPGFRSRSRGKAP